MSEKLLDFTLVVLADLYEAYNQLDQEFDVGAEDYEDASKLLDESVSDLSEIVGITADELRRRVHSCRGGT